MNLNEKLNWVKITNVVQQSLREMDRCPDDCVQTIWNEKLKEWETGLKMNNNYEIVGENEF